MDPGNLFPIDKEYCLDCGTEVQDEGTNQYPVCCPACWAQRQAQAAQAKAKTVPVCCECGDPCIRPDDRYAQENYGGRCADCASEMIWFLQNGGE